ncbi:sporulation histidine kinase inhibitor Sda [Cytobacillus suaedae]|nr:sporulation histidine kinase inhibitor Sda [Cytobacillus suaedae]
MVNLKDLKLLSAYKEAILLELEDEFIDMLEQEIMSRMLNDKKKVE